jgi:hypothetical protein
VSDLVLEMRERVSKEERQKKEKHWDCISSWVGGVWGQETEPSACMREAKTLSSTASSPRPLILYTGFSTSLLACCVLRMEVTVQSSVSAHSSTVISWVFAELFLLPEMPQPFVTKGDSRGSFWLCPCSSKHATIRLSPIKPQHWTSMTTRNQGKQKGFRHKTQCSTRILFP